MFLVAYAVTIKFHFYHVLYKKYIPTRCLKLQHNVNNAIVKQ